jgi:hypothetical protein
MKEQNVLFKQMVQQQNILFKEMIEQLKTGRDERGATSNKTKLKLHVSLGNKYNNNMIILNKGSSSTLC